MKWKSLLAAIIGLSAAVLSQAAWAQASHMFTGVLAITNVTSPACDPVGIQAHALNSVFRPRLLAGEPTAAIIVFGNQGELVQMQEAGISPANMNGSGTYNGTFFDPNTGKVLVWRADPNNTFNLTVTSTQPPASPVPVKAISNYIYVSGTIDNFAGLPGCSLTVNGAYTQPVAAP